MQTIINKNLNEPKKKDFFKSFLSESLLEPFDDYFLNYKNTQIMSPDSLAEIYSVELEKRFNAFDPASELLEAANTEKAVLSNEVLEDKKPESFDFQFDSMKYNNINQNSNNPNNTNTNGVYHNGNSNMNSNNNNNNENTDDEKKFDAFQSEKYFDPTSYDNKNNNQDTYNGNYNNYGGYDKYSYNDNNGMNIADNSNNNPNSNQMDYPMSKENKMPDLSDSNTKDIIEDNSLRDTDILMADDNKGIFDMMTYENMNSNNNNGNMLMNEPNSNQADNFNNGDSHNLGIMSDDITECNYFGSL